MESKIQVLIKTMNFEYAAAAVFNRLIDGNEPGMLVLCGGYPGDVKKANKSYFLDMVEAFQEEIRRAYSQHVFPESAQFTTTA